MTSPQNQPTPSTPRSAEHRALWAQAIDARAAEHDLWVAIADALAHRTITGAEASLMLGVSRATLYRQLDERGLMADRDPGAPT